jgi:hypothetical protein
MSSNTRLSRSTAPTQKKRVQLQKVSDSLHEMLTLKRTKRKNVQHTPEIIETLQSTLICQAITGKNPEAATDLLKMIGSIVYCTLKELRKRERPIDIMDKVIKQYKDSNGEEMFSISAQTVNNALHEIPQSDADQVLTAQNEQVIEDLRSQGLWSNKVMLAIDPNDTEYRGKYINQYHTWGVKGQKELPKRGYKEVTLYSLPSQTIVSSHLRTVNSENGSKKPIPEWIGQIQDAMQMYRKHKSSVSAIFADREFYTGLGMAFSYFGLWDNAIPGDENPRMVVPKKLFNYGAEKKWAFLLNSRKGNMFEDVITISNRDSKFLGDTANRLDLQDNSTCLAVPVITVVLFGRNNDRLNQKIGRKDRKKAHELDKAIQDIENLLDPVEYNYRTYYKSLRPKNFSLPKFSTNRKRIFKDSTEKQLYTEYYRLKMEHLRLNKQKTKMLDQLYFFTVSTRENENYLQHVKEYFELAIYYRERWGIENAFKDKIYKFQIRSNSRKPCNRHSRTILSYMLYNSWHYYRLSRIKREYYSGKKKWKPFTRKMIPIRKKIESIYPRLLTANGFLIENLRTSLQNQVKTILGGVI